MAGRDVRRDTRTEERPRIAHDVLTYLAEHPESHDTLEGIVEWWLLEQEIKHRTALVREVLAELVARGLVLERESSDARVHYYVNRDRLPEIRRLINKSS